MASELNLKSTLKRSSEPLQAELDGEIVMMSVEKGSYYGLDPVGAKIWELIESPKQVSDVVEELLVTYEVGRRQCEEETISFFCSLLDEGLVEVVE